MKKKLSVADGLIYLILFLLLLVMIYPFYYLIIISVMPYAKYMSQSVHLFPNGFTLSYFTKILSKPQVLNSYGISIFVTVVGTVLNMLLSSMLAYVLSKRKLKLRRHLDMFVLIPMVFNGGMIPFYLVIKQLGLMNTIWAYIFPFGVNCFNVIIMKNFFMTLPEEIEESARIDGAGDFRIFWRIIIPISKPAVATITLFYATFHWNEWFWSGLLVTREKLYPITVYLRNLMDAAKVASQTGAVLVESVAASETAAIILLIVIPKLFVYPFIQKYFNKGLVLGAVKG